MHIIPVIDLLNGIVVHAKKGIRRQYQPIASALTDVSQPVDIVKAFLNLHPFKTLYIADLNAIQHIENKGQCHHQLLADIHHTYPELTIWIDAGVNDETVAKQWMTPYTQLVLGSESFASIEQYEALTAKLTEPFTLSLDFSSQGYLGPKALLQNPQHWPAETIVMSLSKVGANTGVDTEVMHDILSTSNKQNIYAAGGIRDINDLITLKKHNVKGALVASALHNKQLSSQDLSSLCT